jgi:hypothetical protein
VPQSSAMRVRQSQRWSASSSSRRVRRTIKEKLAHTRLKAKFSSHFYRVIRVSTFILGYGFVASCYSGVSRDLHASLVLEYLETPGGDASAVYADPARSLGPPDGRTVALGLGSALSLRFFRVIPNGPGPDLRVIEIGPDGAKARIAISDDGESFFEYAHFAN